MSEESRPSFVTRFFSRLWRWITGAFALIGFMSVLSFALLIFFIVRQAQMVDQGSFTVAKVDVEKALVSIELDGPLTLGSVDPQDALLGQFFGQPVASSVVDLQTVLRRAAEDINVHGVYIDLKSVQAGFATLSELRRALVEYRNSGKPLYINAYSLDSLSYYLASSATQLNLTPAGDVLIPGPFFQLTYYGSAIKRLGFDFEVFRAGKYKSAFESFVLDAPSEPTLEMYASLEEYLRQEFVDAISQGRSRSPVEVRSWLRRTSFTAAQALDSGLVDSLSYESGWKENFRQESKAEEFLTWRVYLNSSSELDELRVEKNTDVRLALIEAVGEIRMSAPPSERGVITPERLLARLRWAQKDDSIKAVVFRINSPGGSALASDLIWEEVRKLAEIKPVVVSMGEVAASGGYYIAAPAKKIVAEASTITGSIGVIGASLSGGRLSEKYGVSFHAISKSERVKYLNFGTAASEEDKAVIGESIDQVYQTFITKVAQGRSTTPGKIDALGQGRVYTGQEALSLGLVDVLGGRDVAFREAKKLAELDPDKLYPLAQYQGKPTSIFECLERKERFFECMQELEGIIQIPEIKAPSELGLDHAIGMKKMLEDSRYLSYWPAKLVWSK